MDPRLKPYFDHVFVLFWPVLIWNLMRIARWQAHTGREGLFAVNCYGGIRLVRVSDAPCANAAEGTAQYNERFVLPVSVQLIPGLQILKPVLDWIPDHPLRAVREETGPACIHLPLPET